jgi:hypothetical protein
MPEPGYCDHGKSLRERCFFCRRKAEAPRTGVLPEHRNPPEEARRYGHLTAGGKKGGAATAAKRARERGEESAPVSWSEL